MFFTYLVRELRRRMRQASFIAVGLAVGIGLVITVMAASSGLQNAQATVLHSLYGVGTDMTVTKAPTAGAGGGFGFRLRGQQPGGGSAPKAGQKFSRDALVARQLGTLSASNVATIGGLPHVAASQGALAATDLSISGTIPSSGGGAGAPGAGGGGGGGGSSSFKTGTFAVLGVAVSGGKVGPLSSDKIASGRTFGSSDANANVALVDSNYATQNSLKLGSKVKVAGTQFKVVGIVSEPQGGTTTDVFVPLQRAQSLAGMKNQVNTIYVAATSAADITAVQHSIQSTYPKVTVTTSSSLANQVTGSLSSASSLAKNLGKWLAIAVLIAAVAVASLLTMSAVSRRVREFGTLKALGWRSRRVIGQVMGETFTMCLVGGVVGVALGFAGASLVSALVPSLSATVGQSTGSATPGGGFAGGGGSPGGGPGRLAANAAKTVAVHLSAPVTLTALLLAVLLAVAGGLVAGGFGGWRAARLRPAAALARVE
ncbi:MAG TPA: ABC transporter permease [Streptosporangiaceae bacterium]|nr:ABC transporter permease [Streptosporangiaceae bacterium]